MNRDQFVRRVGWTLLLTLFVLCVALKLNGSSVGIWQTMLKEPGPIRGLLLFKPEKVRTDEWCHITPSMLSQARHRPPFPIENESLGGGRAPLLMSVPVAFYTMLFRPQFWGFFVFDFEHAFAFYWCCKVFGLLVASGWLLRQLGIKSKRIVAFGTVWIFFSSFVQWWFSTPAMLPEMLACWAMLTGCAVRMFSSLRPFDLALAAVGFVFFGANFALCMYPGFQIPLLYLSVAIVIGMALQRRNSEQWKTRQGLTLLCVALLTLVLLLLPLWWMTRDTLRILAGTGYPGVFRSRGGGLSLFDLFSGVVGFFESEQRIPFHYENICEASNFYPLWLATLPMMLLARWRQKVRLPPLVLTIAAASVLIGAYCVIPMPGWLAHGSLLGLTTENRLLLGIGIGTILLSCLFFDSYRQPILERSSTIAIIAAAAGLGAGMLWLRPYPGNTPLCIVIVLINCVIIGTFFWHRARTWFLAIFGGLILLNGAGINPVMRGLSPLLGSQAFVRIDKLRAANPDAKWVFYEDEQLPQLIKATGASVLNGTKILPDLDLMHSLDPNGELARIYDRFAHIKVVLPDEPGAVTFTLIGSYNLEIGLPPEHPALRSKGYQFAVFPRAWTNPVEHGFTFVEHIAPTDLYVFKLQPNQE